MWCAVAALRGGSLACPPLPVPPRTHGLPGDDLAGVGLRLGHQPADAVLLGWCVTGTVAVGAGGAVVAVVAFGVVALQAVHLS